MDLFYRGWRSLSVAPGRAQKFGNVVGAICNCTLLKQSAISQIVRLQTAPAILEVHGFKQDKILRWSSTRANGFRRLAQNDIL
jgi:hypothetical protein